MPIIVLDDVDIIVETCIITIVSFLNTRSRDQCICIGLVSGSIRPVDSLYGRVQSGPKMGWTLETIHIVMMIKHRERTDW